MSYFNAKQYQTYLNSEAGPYARRELRRALDPNYRQDYDPARWGWDNDGYPPENGAATITEEEAGAYLGYVKAAIVGRGGYNTGPTQNISAPGKWWRPWDVVPELANFDAGEGDYGVGVEVEMGFESIEAAQEVAAHIEPWDYITLDFEGGENPIEATFPPVPFSTIKTSRVMEYIQYLSNNSDLVTDHSADEMVGTHVNVSKGGQGIPYHRVSHLASALMELSNDEGLAEKYFDRHPYGYAIGQGAHRDGGYKWVEFKLFNSQTDPERLLQYINEAVCLVELACDESRPVTVQEVHIALEKGYRMDCSVASTEQYQPYEYAVAA